MYLEVLVIAEHLDNKLFALSCWLVELKSFKNLKSQQIWAPLQPWRIFHMIFSLPLNTCQFSAVLAHLYSLINSYIPFFINATHDPKEWYKQFLIMILWPFSRGILINSQNAHLPCIKFLSEILALPTRLNHGRRSWKGSLETGTGMRGGLHIISLISSSLRRNLSRPQCVLIPVFLSVTSMTRHEPLLLSAARDEVSILLSRLEPDFRTRNVYFKQ